MTIKDFFRLYESGNFEENALSSCVTRKIKIINEPLNSINTEVEAISLYKQFKVRKQHEKMRTYYCWSTNKLFSYKCKLFTNEAACVYDFLASNKEKFARRIVFYNYEPVIIDDVPVGAVVGLPTGAKKDAVAYVFYLLDTHTFNIEATGLEEAKEKAYDLTKAHKKEIKSFQKESKCTEK